MSGVEPYGHYFTDDPAKFAMPGGGFKLGPIPPDDCISVIPVYSQATVDTLRAQLEAVQAEVKRLTGCLTQANYNTEEFERKWYLAQDRAEAAEADAARYRWLRVNEQDRCDAFLAGAFEDLDAAIDAAIARTKEETT